MRSARIFIWIVVVIWIVVACAFLASAVYDLSYVGTRQTVTSPNPVTVLPEETNSYPDIVGATERQ